jgi:FAD/FMN-containing dehydrogenase
MEISGGAGASLDALAQAALEEAAAADLVTDAVLAQNQAQVRQFWHMRETISEAEKREGVSIKHDISVPVAAIPAFIAEATAAVLERFPGARPVCFGHMGDGNLHFNFSAPPGQNEAFAAQWDEMQLLVHDIVRSYCGSISAEHGIGRFKRDEMRQVKPAPELDMMLAIKAALDPEGLMNPHALLPGPSGDKPK